MDWSSASDPRGGSSSGGRSQASQSMSDSGRQTYPFGQSFPQTQQQQPRLPSTQPYEAQTLADPFALQQELLPQYGAGQPSSLYQSSEQQQGALAPNQSTSDDADRFASHLANVLDPPEERQARTYIFNQAWRPCTNNRSLNDFVASLRAPYSFRSLGERWQWLGEPQLDTDVGVYPLQAEDPRPTIRGTLSALRLNPNLVTLSRYQERAFELDLAACVGGDLSSHQVKPLMHFSFHASLYSAFHAELLVREQGLDHREKKRIREATLRGFVNDFDTDRKACQSRAQHLCLLRLMWGEAVDCAAEVLRTHCSVVVENLHLPGGDNARTEAQRDRGASGSSTSSNRVPHGMPGYPQSPTMYMSMPSGEGSVKRESGLPMGSPNASRSGFPTDPHSRQWGGYRPPGQTYDPSEAFAGSGHEGVQGQGVMPRIGSSPYGSFEQTNLEADINSQLRAQYSPSSLYSGISNISSSPTSLRSMTGDYSSMQPHTGAMRPGFSTSPRHLRGGMSMPYGMPVGTQTILATSSRRILQNRQKSKRHYNRKKLQRSLLADVLIVFGQVVHMLRQIPTVEALSGQASSQQSGGSSAPATLAESRFGVGVAACLTQRVTPPAELTSVVNTATEAILSTSDRSGTAGETSGASGHSSDFASDWADSLASGSSSTQQAITSAGVPVDLALPPALAAAGAAATMPALSALSTNERKRLSKMMQRHLEVQRMQQVSSMARHLLGWMQQTEAHQLSPNVTGESVFNERENATTSSSGESYEPGSAVGGLNMNALRTAVTTMAVDPDTAAVFAFVQAWRSFRASWQDLVQAEARLSNRSQRPVSQLVETIDRRTNESGEAEMREQQRYSRVAASILGMQQPGTSSYAGQGDEQQQRSGMSSASHASQAGDPSYVSNTGVPTQSRSEWS